MAPSVTYIDVEEPGQRIDNFLIRMLKAVPRARIYRMLRRGEVRVNGARVKPAYRVRVGDRVRVPPVRNGRPPTIPPRRHGLEASLRESVLFEDDGLLILDKPAGLAVHGGSGVSLGLIEALRAGRSERFLELAHRLDRETSGCLIIAKSRGALRELHVLQRERRIGKRYDLLVSGCWPSGLGVVDLRLHRYVTASGERRVRVATHGKPSRTIFDRVETTPAASWMRARLHTGRTHQIRVHAAASGHPVLGEDKYGSQTSALCSRAVGVSRLCLHASRLSFRWHGSLLRVEAPTPSVFRETWDRLSNRSSNDL